MLGWTLTGPGPQEYFQPNNKGSSNHNITLFNHLKRGSDDPDENLLHLLRTFEGVNFSQGSKKVHNEEDQKALKTLAETTHHNRKRYEIGLPWRENVTLPNNYFMARVQWHALAEAIRERQPTERKIYEHYLWWYGYGIHSSCYDPAGEAAGSLLNQRIGLRRG